MSRAGLFRKIFEKSESANASLTMRQPALAQDGPTFRRIIP